MKKELAELMVAGLGERAPARFLKKYPALFRPAINQPDNGGYVLAEFSIGGNYRADFVSLRPTSQWFHVAFIELEPIDAQLFTKKGEPRKELNHAFNQIDRWRMLIERERLHVVRRLAEVAAIKDILYGHKLRPEDITCTAGSAIDDPSMTYSFEYFIFIGRRGTLSKVDIQFKNAFMANRHIHVATYDRLVDVAKSFDAKSWDYD